MEEELQVPEGLCLLGGWEIPLPLPSPTFSQKMPLQCFGVTILHSSLSEMEANRKFSRSCQKLIRPFYMLFVAKLTASDSWN